jgi:hypothetical protein
VKQKDLYIQNLVFDIGASHSDILSIIEKSISEKPYSFYSIEVMFDAKSNRFVAIIKYTV